MSIFQGELMTCVSCQFQQRSHPTIESGWFKVSASFKGYAGSSKVDICPKCALSVCTPQCQTCNRFYHERYGPKCPWCEHSEGGKQSSSKGFGR